MQGRDSNTGEAEAGKREFRVCVGYIVRPSLKNKTKQNKQAKKKGKYVLYHKMQAKWVHKQAGVQSFPLAKKQLSLEPGQRVQDCAPRTVQRPLVKTQPHSSGFSEIPAKFSKLPATAYIQVLHTHPGNVILDYQINCAQIFPQILKNCREVNASAQFVPFYAVQ